MNFPVVFHPHPHYNNHVATVWQQGLPLDVVRIISGKLWEDTFVIDEYISKNKQNMSEEHISIVRGWKRVVHGKFVVERHLKNGSILISCDEDGSVYRVHIKKAEKMKEILMVFDGMVNGQHWRKQYVIERAFRRIYKRTVVVIDIWRC